MNVAIIAAAGRGSRMAGTRPKQFLELAGTPIIFHTLRPFDLCDSIQEIVVVLPAEEVSGFRLLVDKAGFPKLSQVVPGGETRAESVVRGLESVHSSNVDIVAIHDGVRPFVTAGEISSTVAAARESGAAILVAPLIDTVKEISGNGIVRTVDRARLRKALTPQCFRFDLLRRAYKSVDLRDSTLTDDSSVVERTGFQVTVVEGSSRNIKITTHEDLALAEAVLRRG
jgi:2-C-methyl-D-erythritol 4-phosphate cytidylyltransferase